MRFATPTAACPRTRRSTSGIALKTGTNALGARSKTQATVAVSSGEAEFVAMHQGIIEALAARSLLSEVLRKSFKIVAPADSSAARAMARRAGPACEINAFEQPSGLAHESG